MVVIAPDRAITSLLLLLTNILCLSFEIFDRLHVRQVDENLDKRTYHQNDLIVESNKVGRNLTFGDVRLHCCNIWFPSQSSFSFDDAFGNSYECIFSVVQSTAGISPSKIYSEWEEQLFKRGMH